MTLRNPHGHVFNEGVRLSDEKGQALDFVPDLNKLGAHFYLKLDPSKFALLGDYQLTLGLSALSSGVSERVFQILTVKVAVASSKIKRTNPSALPRLSYRSWPIGSANQEIRLQLKEWGGMSGTRRPEGKVSTTVKGKEQLVDASFRFSLPDASDSLEEVLFPANQFLNLDVFVSGLEKVGRHRVDVQLLGSAGEDDTHLSFEVLVTDHPLWPLLCISLGVLLSFLLRRNNQEISPMLALEEELTIFQLGLEELKGWDPENMGLRDLELEAAQLQTRLTRQSVEKLAALPAALIDKLDKIRGELMEERTDLWQKLERLENRLSTFSDDLEEIHHGKRRSQEDVLLLTRYRNDVEEIRAHLRDLRMVAARPSYLSLENTFQARLKFHIRAILERCLDLEQSLKKGEDYSKFLELLRLTQEGLEASDLYPLWRQQGLLLLRLDEACQKSSAPGYDSHEFNHTKLNDFSGHPVNTVSRRPELLVKTPVQDRKVGEEIEFFVQNGDNLSEWNWSREDGGRLENNGEQSKKAIFEQSGPKQVSVTATAGQTSLRLFVKLEIKPSDTLQKLKNLRSRQNWNNIMVSAMSLLGAVLLAMTQFYSNVETFGSISDYAAVFLWGFGIDSSVKGVAGMFNKTGAR